MRAAIAILFIIGIVALFFLFGKASDGLKNIPSSHQTSYQSSLLGAGKTYYQETPQTVKSQTTYPLPKPVPIAKKTTSPTEPKPEPEPEPAEPEPEPEPESNLSPYFGKVKLSNISGQSSGYYSSSYGYYSYRTTSPALITLRVYLKTGEELNITNWRVKGYKGEVIIPQGIEKYRSSAPSKDVIIKPGDIVYLIAASSPLGTGKNFRINKCFGYFLNDYNFYPSFSKSCPKSRRVEEISHLSPTCQDFILRLPSCQIPNYSDLKIVYDDECISYMRERFSYNACYENHYKDNDFLKKYWYLYVGRDIVTKTHDTLYLLDQNGLIVDKYLY